MQLGGFIRCMICRTGANAGQSLGLEFLSGISL